MIGVDTPDFQRGVASVQKLLAQVPAGTQSLTVGAPPNTETLVVIVSENAGGGQPSVTGAQSGIVYPGVPWLTTSGRSAWQQSSFDVSTVIDSELTITFPQAPTLDWWVFSDSASRIVWDPALVASVAVNGADTPPAVTAVGGTDGTFVHTLLTDLAGHLWTIPELPAGGAGNHPSQDLQAAGFVLSATGGVVGSPGTGRRLRVLAAQVIPFAGAVNGYLYDSASGMPFCAGANSGAGNIQFLPTGLPLSENAGVVYSLNGGTGEQFVLVVYVAEDV